MHGVKLSAQHQPLTLRVFACSQQTAKRHARRGSSAAPRTRTSASLTDPVLRAAVKEPLAFSAGVVAGLLGLNLSEDPLKEWLERTAANSRGEPSPGPSTAAAGSDRLLAPPTASSTNGQQRRLQRMMATLPPSAEGTDPPAGALCRGLPAYCTTPPGTAVVFGFGVAEDGQLGVDTEADLLSPKVIESLLGTRLRGRDFTASPLVGGSRNTLAIDADGQLLAWGWNARGTLGHGHRTTERKPRYVSELRGVRIVQAALGGWHTLALDDTGQAWAFGGNEYQQATGEPNEEGPGHDVVTPQPCLQGVRVAQVAAGGMHSVALTDEGEVWTWGEPWGFFSLEINREPRKVEGATSIAKVACGAFHNLLLTWDGEVYAWGINDFGQLGNGTTSYATTPVKVVGLEDTPIADISAGGWHSLALTTTGEVFVWGRGEYGRLGLGDKSGSSKLRPTLVQSISGERVVQAVCGGTHTIALTDEGRIFIWGRGSFGRLGTGNERDHHSPISLSLPGGPGRWRVISLCAGGRHSMVLAVPDGSSIERDADGTSSARSSPQLRPLSANGHSQAVDGDSREGASPPASTEPPPEELVLQEGGVPGEAASEGVPGGSSDEDDGKVGGSSDDDEAAKSFHRPSDPQDEGEGYVGGGGRRLGGADSPEYRDSMGHAQVNLIERAMASSDMHDLISDD